MPSKWPRATFLTTPIPRSCRNWESTANPSLSKKEKSFRVDAKFHGRELNATEADLVQARSFAARTSLDELFKVCFPAAPPNMCSLIYLVIVIIFIFLINLFFPPIFDLFASCLTLPMLS